MNNKIQWYLFLSIILVNSFANAQNVSFKWGEEFSEKQADKYGDIIYCDENFIYMPFSNYNYADSKGDHFRKSCLRIGNGSQEIAPGIIKLDRNLKQVAREQFYSEDQKDTLFNSLFYLDGEFVMILSKYISKTKTTEVYGVLIDKNTLKFKGLPKLIWTLPEFNIKDIDLLSDASFDVTISDDTTTFALTCNKDQKDKENKKFQYALLDKDLNVLRQKNIELKYSVADFNKLNYLINSNRDFYVYPKITKEYIDKNEKDIKSNSSGMASKIIMLKFGNDDTEKEIILEKKGKVINTLNLFENSISKLMYLICTFKSETSHGIVGYGTYFIDSKTNSVKGEKFNEFASDFVNHLNKVDPKRAKTENPGIADSYMLRYFIIRSDNKIDLIFEDNQEEFIIKMQTNGPTKTERVFWSFSIIPVEMDLDGNQIWINCIPKYQVQRVVPMFVSSSVFCNKNSLRIFYNDVEENKNYDLKSDETPERFQALKYMNLMMAEIDSKGNLKINELINSNQTEFPFYIGGSQQLDSKSFFIYCYNEINNHGKFGIVTFD